MDFAGKTVWITGASSGIGSGLAIALVAEGAKLILSGRNEAALAEVSAQCPGSTVLAFDATDLGALPGIVKRAEAMSGGIDMLVNNAGIGSRGFAQNMAFDVYRRVMEIDFFAPLRLTQLVLPGMLARGSGHIAVVSSLSGKFGSPGSSAYCAAKFALIGYFDALRSEVAHQGLKVTVITPGFVKTSFGSHLLGSDGKPFDGPSLAGGRGISPADSAEQIIAGFKAGMREIPVGKGPEMVVLELLKTDSNQVFDLMAGMANEMMKPGA